MRRIAVPIAFVLGLLFAVGQRPLHAAATAPGLPETKEIISALKSNYVDREKLDSHMLDEATVTGILDALGRGATIVPSDTATTNSGKTATAESKPVNPIARAEIIDPDIGYIRLADVSDTAVSAFDTELKKLADEKAVGLVLDLRFADGTNYDAAAAIAGQFVNNGEELFTLKDPEKGSRVFRASMETKPVSLDGLDLTTVPIILLVNVETRGSAEALAGALRIQQRGILVGSKTAGTAAGWKDVPLSDGQMLRLATAKIILPAKDEEGGKPVDLFPGGMRPDVKVKIDPKVEREVVLEAQTNQTLTASLQPRVQKKGMSEAELVKAFRGQPVDTDTNGATSTDKDSEEEGEIQNVRDVVLQRAVDILKGIRVLLSWQ
ncbi:MAG TPA: S41 family peptidase [Verrucomicrobiae bacterium]|nr:S41 family peptidase [Verrucomicrobiae bacterium]